MPKIPFKKDVPDYRTVVPGIWSDTMNDMSASYTVLDPTSTAKKVDIVKIVDQPCGIVQVS